MRKDRLVNVGVTAKKPALPPNFISLLPLGELHGSGEDAKQMKGKKAFVPCSCSLICVVFASTLYNPFFQQMVEQFSSIAVMLWP